jgi:hypothetical protein
LGVQSQQLLMKSRVFKDEVLTGTESADLSLPRMPSGANAFEISNIQEAH